MSGQEEHIRSSVLDRLIDLEPTAPGEPVRYHAATFRELRAAICRDLENLLNTRNFVSAGLDEYRELDSSLLGYGLRDHTSANPRSPLLKRQLRQELEKVIGCFEPRLHNVTVRIQEPEGNERNLRFKISGLVLADSMAEPVVFDTVFDVNRGEYSIPK